MQKATRFEASFWTFDVSYAMQDLRTALFGVHGIAVLKACVPLAHARFFGSAINFDQQFTATAAVIQVLGLGGRGPDKCQRFFGLPELKTFQGRSLWISSFYAIAAGIVEENKAAEG